MIRVAVSDDNEEHPDVDFPPAITRLHLLPTALLPCLIYLLANRMCPGIQHVSLNRHHHHVNQQ